MSPWVGWEKPLIAVGAGFHFAMAWAMLWRYLQTRQPQLLAWSAGWAVLTLRIVAMLADATAPTPAARAIESTTYVLSAALFLAGQAAVRLNGGRRPPLSALAALVFAPAAGVAAITLALPAAGLWTRLVSGLMGGAAFLAAAHRLRRDAALPLGGAERLLAAGLVLGAAVDLAAVPATGTAWELPLSMAGSAAFSLVFGAAMMWQVWEEARAVRLFQRILEVLNQPHDTGGALESSLDAILAHMGMRQGWVLLRAGGRGGAGGLWALAAARGFPEWATHGVGAQEYSIDRCVCLRGVDRAELLSGVTQVPCTRLSQEQGRPTGHHAVVPLGAGSGVQGVLVLVLPHGRPLTGPQHRLVQALGEQIGLALDRIRLTDELREKERDRAAVLARLITAQEDERRRIARELHDEVGQSLSAVLVNLDLCHRRVSDPELSRQLKGIQSMVDQTLAEIRRVIHDLRPTVLDDLGLEAAVTWLATHHLRPAGLAVALEVQGLHRRLPPAVETAVFRVVQEASTNTVKHAAARHLTIRLIGQDSRVLVEVADDGRGFSTRQRAVRHTHGLSGLRERVTLVGGTLEIRSAAGRGTRVRAEIPVPAEQEQGSGEVVWQSGS